MTSRTVHIIASSISNFLYVSLRWAFREIVSTGPKFYRSLAGAPAAIGSSRCSSRGEGCGGGNGKDSSTFDRRYVTKAAATFIPMVSHPARLSMKTEYDDRFDTVTIQINLQFLTDFELATIQYLSY